MRGMCVMMCWTCMCAHNTPHPLRKHIKTQRKCKKHKSDNNQQTQLRHAPVIEIISQAASMFSSGGVFLGGTA